MACPVAVIAQDLGGLLRACRSLCHPYHLLGLDVGDSGACHPVLPVQSLQLRAFNYKMYIGDGTATSGSGLDVAPGRGHVEQSWNLAWR